MLLEAPRLEDQHTTARQELIEARLALGEHADLVPEVEALVAEHPFDERLRGQLMLALYRAGRQAEALEVYRDARRFLVEELGLEPSTPLRELEQAILRHDTALTPARARRPAALPMRKTATVLVTELVDPDASDQLDPEALSRLLDRHFPAIQATVERHSGTVKRSLGEAVIAVFGVPKAHEDDAVRALRAALELRDEFPGASDELGLRIGVDTGEMFVSDSPSVGLVTGAVLASGKRLADGASAGEILLGAGTVRLVRGVATTEALEPLGVQEGRQFGAWRLLGLIEGAPAIPRRLEAPLVGRGEELASLRRAFESTLDQAGCRLVVVVGEPGIGKTRLARELVAEVGQEAHVLVGSCASYGEGATWLPLAEILREAGAETLAALRALLAGEPDGELVGSRVAGAIGLLEQPASLVETNWAIRRLFEVLARERPLLLLFEDVHWAEPTLLDLIDYLGGRASGPILLLCLTRPELLETRTGWAKRALTLGPLPEADVRTLVGALPADLEADAHARVVEVAEGNPLFAEQLVAHAKERGSESLAVAPPSIEALLASRFDLLPVEELTVLQRAAVLGRRFSRASVLELSAEDPASTDLRLRSLTKKGFIRLGASDDSLGFHHVLVRNVAYAGIPKGVRADLHEQAADCIERQENRDELVGYHLEQAYRCRSELLSLDEHALGLARRAAERLAAAALRARATDDMRTAASLLDRAAELLPRRDPLRLQLLTRLGEALVRDGEVRSATAVLGEAIEGAKAVDDPRIEWDARLQGSFVSRLSDHEAWTAQARREVERAIEACEELDYAEGLGKAWHLLGLLEWDLGHDRAAAEAFERALVYSRRSHDERAEAMALQALAVAAVFGPMPTADAIRLLESHRQLARAGGASFWEANCDELLAVLWAMRGQFGKARGMLADASSLRDDLGASGAGSVAAAARVERLAGNLAAAEHAYQKAYRLFSEQDLLAFAPVIAAELAYVLQAQKRDQEALQLIERSEHGMSSRAVVAQVFRRRTQARVLARRGAFDEAERLAREAVKFGTATDDVLLRGDALMDLAAVLHLAGRVKEAVGALQQALRLYEMKGNLVSFNHARDLLEEVKTAVSPIR